MRAQCQSGIRDPAGHHNIRTPIECLRYRLRAEIEIGRNDVAALREQATTDLARTKLGGRQSTHEVVALDHSDPRRSQ